MPEQRTDPVRPDGTEAPPESPAPRHLCITSGDPLRSRAFIAALHSAVSANGKLTIIVDRRRGGSETATGRPPVDRRRRPHVDVMVKTDGFAIVPLSTDDARGTDSPWNSIPHVFDPPIEARAVERRPVESRWDEPPSLERQSLDDDADADERELKRILEFKRRHQRRVPPLLGLSALVGVLVVLVVVLVQLPAAKTLMSRARPVALPPAERTSEPQPPLVVETLSPPPQTSASPQPGGGPPKSPEPAPPPAEPIIKPLNAPQAPVTTVTPPPRPQTSESPRPGDSPASPEPGPPPAEPIIEPLNAPQAPVATVTPPPSPQTSASPPPGGPPASAEPMRSPEATSTPRAHTAAIPSDSPAPPSGAPSRPIARGLDARIKDLETQLSRDMSAAGSDAKRMVDELKVQAAKRLDEMRRVWNNAKQALTDSYKDLTGRTTTESPR
jgi:ElaB/YqjD/DUF883 family membrane-anchored ribosome-binding protein